MGTTRRFVKREKPPLEAPWPGTLCPKCGEEASALVDFCWRCDELEKAEIERHLQIQEAKQRTRAWRYQAAQS